MGELTCGVTGSGASGVAKRGPGHAGTVISMDTSWWLALAAVVLLAGVATLVDGWGRGGSSGGRGRSPGRSARSAAGAASGTAAGAAFFSSAARRDLVGECSVRGRARGEGPALPGSVRAGPHGCRRQDHQQEPRRAAGRGDSASARVRRGRPRAGQLPRNVRAAGSAGTGLPPTGGPGGPRDLGPGPRPDPLGIFLAPAAPTRSHPYSGAQPPNPRIALTRWSSNAGRAEIPRPHPQNRTG